MNPRVFILPLISAFFLIFASCSDNFITNDGFCWGTSYHIVYNSGSDLSDSIKTEIERIDASLSMFNPESLISAVNDSRSDSVDALFADVFRLSQRVNILSGGVFDPTVGPLVDLWGFGRRRDKTAGEPDSAEIAVALTAVGISDCRLCGDGRRVIKKSPATAFDFSAVAKGYGVDCVAAMLRRNGVRDYMVEIGGEIALLGRNPRGGRWRIQIDAPVASDSNGAPLHNRYTVLELGPEATAVAGSGNYRNSRRTADGSVIGHTISAIDGRPVGSSTLAASVIAPTCALADALATAAMAMPPDSALAMAGRLRGEGVALLLICDGGSDCPYLSRATADYPRP